MGRTCGLQPELLLLLTLHCYCWTWLFFRRKPDAFTWSQWFSHNAKKRGAASNGSLQTIVLTRTNPITCHQVGGDQMQARVQRENAVITGQVTNTTILRQPVACWAEADICILSFPAGNGSQKNILFIQPPTYDDYTSYIATHFRISFKLLVEKYAIAKINYY